MRWIKHLFTQKKKQDVPNSEVLTSVLIPSDHHERFLLTNEVDAFFAPYMEYIGQSLGEVYGLQNIARRQRITGKNFTNLFVDTPFLRVEYRVAPLELLDGSPSIFYGELSIKQPRIHFEQTGKLYEKLLQAHPGQDFTLSYSNGDEPGFQIYHMRGNDILSSGETLLRRMEIETPNEGLSYTQGKNTQFWKKVPVELQQ